MEVAILTLMNPMFKILTTVPLEEIQFLIGSICIHHCNLQYYHVHSHQSHFRTNICKVLKFNTFTDPLSPPSFLIFCLLTSLLFQVYISEFKTFFRWSIFNTCRWPHLCYVFFANFKVILGPTFLRSRLWLRLSISFHISHHSFVWFLISNSIATIYHLPHLH